MDDIDSMEAGPDMDALVAEKVMGYRKQAHHTGWWSWVDRDGLCVPNDRNQMDYSTDIAAAYPIIGKLGLSCSMTYASVARTWVVSFFDGGIVGQGKANELPEAISKAALLVALAKAT